MHVEFVMVMAAMGSDTSCEGLAQSEYVMSSEGLPWAWHVMCTVAKSKALCRLQLTIAVRLIIIVVIKAQQRCQALLTELQCS